MLILLFSRQATLFRHRLAPSSAPSVSSVCQTSVHLKCSYPPYPALLLRSHQIHHRPANCLKHQKSAVTIRDSRSMLHTGLQPCASEKWRSIQCHTRQKKPKKMASSAPVLRLKPPTGPHAATTAEGSVTLVRSATHYFSDILQGTYSCYGGRCIEVLFIAARVSLAIKREEGGSAGVWIKVCAV